MNCLIVGYGSIGQRHANLLQNLDNDVSIVSGRKITRYKCFPDIKSAIKAEFFDYIVISNETYKHYQTLMDICETGYRGLILVEKPLFEREYKLLHIVKPQIFVGYNLRFHPAIQEIKKLVKEKRIFSIHVYCGSYLPSWRPNSDYRKCYSASRKAGGGVLRDLSHELDYVNWISGGWKRLTAIGGKFSELEITSDDVFCLLLESDKCAAISLQINYLDRQPCREIIVNCRNMSIKADLIKNSISVNDEVAAYHLEKDTTYINQHKALLNCQYDTACNLEQGLEVLSIINAAEKASEMKKWIRN